MSDKNNLINISNDDDNGLISIKENTDKDILINGAIIVSNSIEDSNFSGIKFRDRANGEFSEFYLDDNSIFVEGNKLIREDELESTVNNTTNPLVFSNVNIDINGATDGNKKGIIHFFNSGDILNPNPNLIEAPVGLRRHPTTGNMQFRNESANWVDIPGSSFQVTLEDPETGQILVYNKATGLFANTNFAISNDATPILGGNLDAGGNNIVFQDNNGILDDSRNKLLIFDETNSSSDYELLLTKTTSGPKFIASGSNNNIDLDIHAKGEGDIKIQTNSTNGDIILSANTHTIMSVIGDSNITGDDGHVKLEGMLKLKSGNNNYYVIDSLEHHLNSNITLKLPNLNSQDEFVFKDHAETLTNKTLTLPQINDTSSNHQYVFAVNELVADRNVTLPLLGTDDEFVFKDHAVTLTNKALTSPVLTTPQINDASSDHKYIFAGSELVADRTVTLPILGEPDTFVFESHTQTLTNKTINLANNTLTGTLALFNTALSDADFCTLDGSETLTNKGINLANNTLTGTKAQFNTALSDADFCTLAGSETLTNKTINLANNNTLTGTLSEFNTALSNGTFATTADLDDRVQGLDIKESVKVATTASFTMASTASATTLVLANGEGGFDNSADTLTIDGISLSQNDRVLIKDGVNSASTGVNHKWNGIYTVGALDGTTLTLSRASDADSNADLTGGTFVFVEQGTVNSNNGFVFTHNGTPTLGTTLLTVSQFSGAGSFIAGTHLSRDGNTLNVDTSTLLNNLLVNNADDTTSGTITAAGFTTSGNLDIEGDIAMATGKKITWVDDNQYISGTATGITIESDDTFAVNADTSVSFNSNFITHQSLTDAHATFTIKSTNTTDGEAHLNLISKNATSAGDGIQIKSLNGVLTIASDHDTSGTYDETIMTLTGHGTNSSRTTEITGNLNVSNNLDIEGDIDMSVDKKITWVDDNQYISGTATGITIESDDTLVVNADTSMTFDSPSIIYQSNTANKPLFEINNTANDANGPSLQLGNKRGTNAGVNDDIAGTINFFNNDSGNNNQNFGQIKVIASDVTNTSEIGKLTIGVACSDDGGVDDILTIVGGTSGQTSSSTIAGELTVQNNTLITNNSSSHSSLTIKSTNTSDGEAHLNLISDNAEDVGDGFQIKSLNGVLTIASDHNSSGTYGETIMTLTGNDTDSSRTTAITGNLNVSGSLSVAGGLSASFDNSTYSSVSSSSTIDLNLSSSSNYHIKTNTGLSSLAIVLEVTTNGSMTGKSGQIVIENLTVNPSTISWTTGHGWYFESDSNGDTIIPTLTGVTGAIDIFNYLIIIDSTTESNRKILVTKASHFQSHT